MKSKMAGEKRPNLRKQVQEAEKIAEKIVEEFELNKVGNYAEYKHEPQVTMPFGILTTKNTFKGQNLVLKSYEIGPDYDSFNDTITRGDAFQFISGGYKPTGLAAHSGVGFVILSGEMLNIARWRAEPDRAHVLVNDLYELNKRKGGLDLVRLDVNREGAFCGWERAIAMHETKAWMRYLQSDRAIDDKVKYLLDQIQGGLRVGEQTR
jgi:hypothetical protein